MYWAGVDVGGKRKGFHVAVLESGRGDELRLVLHAQLAGADAARALSSLLSAVPPVVVAVDSPRRAAPPGRTSRPCEDALDAAIGCGIRGTRDAATIRTRQDDIYEWIEQGWDLYRTLERRPGWRVIECFPTATWARLDGLRGSVRRERWSEQIMRSKLERSGVLKDLPKRCNQDVRDAIGAACTAYLHGRRPPRTQAFSCSSCEIVVPVHDPFR